MPFFLRRDTRPRFRDQAAEEPTSAAPAALSDKKLRRTNSAAAVGWGEWFGPARRLIFEA